MVGMRVFGFALLIWCLCFLLHTLAQQTHPTEVSALQSIKKRLVDPKKYLNSWKKGDPCLSNWTGVECFDTMSNDGYMHIRELHLFHMGLSGTLVPEVGQLSHLEKLDFMWNKISGSIPKEIGNLSNLSLLLLNANNLSGSMPDELGFLSKLNRLQLDENQISGPIPKSFAQMKKLEHLHLNNNSISGQIPSELSQSTRLVHILLDNNNLSGVLPPELSEIEKLQILQLDNNQLMRGVIPESYLNLSSLVKISLRNCSLGGVVPEFSKMPNLSYVDLSWNHFTGPIPSNKLSDKITTIILSHNNLNGSIPESLSNLPCLQLLALDNNTLDGSIPASIWQNMTFNATARLLVDLRYNLLSDVSGDLNPPQNVTLRLRGNPVCNRANIPKLHQFCNSDMGANGTSDADKNSTCPPHTCPVSQHYEPVPAAPTCFCAAPIGIGYRLKSPSFVYFPPFRFAFEYYITNTLRMELYQFHIDSYEWEKGPRLRMYLKLFPNINNGNVFNNTELYQIIHIYSWWKFPGSELFGPYELLNFTLEGPYSKLDLEGGKGVGISKGALAGILIGAIICAATASAVVTLFILRRKDRVKLISKKNVSSKISINIDGVKGFTFKELSQATSNFVGSMEVGQGGYGKVYRGILADNTIVAIKRAEEGSLQGKREFLTEIQLLSRLHHRNLVSLIGYCDEDGEQMIVYEFMSNGTLRDWLSGKHEKTLNFVMRLRMALGAAKGILYLHTEANPPIFHRDIKATNILLDSHLTAKVADFGLSRLAPVLDDEGSVPHHVSTIVKGTPGYLDPEYFLTHKLTDKSDVYSLGVVLLELLTGVPPISHGKNIVREVNMAQQSGSVFDIIDKNMGVYPSECLERFIALGLRCCQDKPELRPSMLDVVRELENILHIIPDSMNMSESEITSSSMPSHSSSSLTSFTNVKYAHMSSEVSGSDLTTTVIPSITPR